MTKKRFYTDGQYVMQKGKVWVVAGGEHSADVIATALNELIEEKNKLQFDYNMEVLRRQSIEKENEQLKQKWKEKRHEDINELSVIAMKYKALENENERLKEENKLLRITLKQEEEVSKEIKQSIIKRIDDYIWEWEDEGTPVADEMKKLKDDIFRGYLE